MLDRQYTVDQWVDKYKEISSLMKLRKGISRSSIMAFLEKHNFRAPEEYIHFLELTNGASLFGGKVHIWEIPDGENAIPNWKNIEYMNQDIVNGSFPDIEDVFLIGSNYLGDYIGICMNDKEFDIIYISPEMGESWNYYTFTDWLHNTWKEMIE